MNLVLDEPTPYRFKAYHLNGCVAWLPPDRGNVYAGNAAQFVAASGQYLSKADNASLSTGDVDFAVGAWVYLDSLNVTRGVICKGVVGLATQEYTLYIGSDNKAYFAISNGTTLVTSNPTAALSVSTWYFIVGHHDAVNNTVGISLNTVAAASATTGATIPQDAGASFAVGDSSDLMDGRLDAAFILKSPPGGIAGVITTIASTLYNSGAGRRAEEITATQRTAWGLVSWWDFESDTASGTGIGKDSVGSNNLASTVYPTGAAGVALSQPVAGDRIRQWSDLSGQGNHATQSGSGLKPAFQSGIVAGKPVVRFDGSNDFLAFASALIPANAQFSVFMVLTPTSEAVKGTILSQYTAGQAGRLAWVTNSDDGGVAVAGRLLLDINGTTEGAGSGGAIDDFAYSGTQILSVVNAGTSETYKPYLNGVVKESATCSAVHTGANTAIGSLLAGSSSQPYHGDLAELIIYSRALNAGEHLRVLGYLGRKYGIGVS